MKTYGIDTNIVLRLIVDDDPLQRHAVMAFGAKLNKEYLGFVTLVSLIELDWALRTQYHYSRKECSDAIGSIIRIRGVQIESHDVVVLALRQVKIDNVDFADAIISGRSSEIGCEVTMTLDKKAAKHIPAMELLA